MPQFQRGHPLYPPKRIQVLVGSSPDSYHYASPIFEVNQQTAEEQEFILSPDVAVGEYIKLVLIGKPKKQSIDQKYYIALRYVGVKGKLLSQI